MAGSSSLVLAASVALTTIPQPFSFAGLLPMSMVGASLTQVQTTQKPSTVKVQARLSQAWYQLCLHRSSTSGSHWTSHSCTHQHCSTAEGSLELWFASSSLAQPRQLTHHHQCHPCFHTPRSRLCISSSHLETPVCSYSWCVRC